jgi:hypothetical protein
MAVAYPMARPGEIEVRKVIRDGNLVAVLMAIDQGDSFTVVTEVFGTGTEGPENVLRRPYTFPDADAGLAFLAEAVTAFTYLGCEVRQQ